MWIALKCKHNVAVDNQIPANVVAKQAKSCKRVLVGVHGKTESAETSKNKQINHG